MLFQLVLIKFFKSELFSCLPKVDHVITSCKRPVPDYLSVEPGFSILGVLELYSGFQSPGFQIPQQKLQGFWNSDSLNGVNNEHVMKF